MSAPPQADGRPTAPSPADGRPLPVLAWVLVAVVAMLVVAAVVIAVTDPYDGLQATGPGGPTGSAEPDGPGVPGGGPDEPPAAEVEALVLFVERERGIDFITEPDIVFAPEDEFVEILLAESDEDEGGGPTTDDYEHVYRAIGWIEPDDDLDDVLDAFLGVGVVGFYLPGEDILYVRGADLTPYTRLVLVHELVHALDDQHVDLDRPEYDDRLDEVSFGLSAVAEGNATRVENAYRASLSDDERAALSAEEMAALDGVDIGDIPLQIALLQLIPYQDGETLVDAIIDDGGPAALDAAFADPPTTSEQVLDPAAYLAGEGAVEVEPPPADGEVVVEGVFGQAAIEVMLYLTVGPGQAEDAASGWAGDWYVAWEADGRSCLRVDTRMDDGAQADELADAWTEWADDMPDADVELLAGADSTVRLTSCVTIGG